MLTHIYFLVCTMLENVYRTVADKFMVIRSINTGFHYQDFRKLLTFIETHLLLYLGELIIDSVQIQAVWSSVEFYIKFRKFFS